MSVKPIAVAIAACAATAVLSAQPTPPSKADASLTPLRRVPLALAKGSERPHTAERKGDRRGSRVEAPATSAVDSEFAKTRRSYGRRRHSTARSGDAPISLH